ncbi:MAG: DUF2244 domain-containing protein [Chromatiales bacterium]|jgi:uncharacterized membrane protein|nr:DUF2244 domain-containing protein [Chromatiales bacterium]MDX9767261.1 DUF2244 domain-containing protein [Ectothiorhodospiraceae bacterium]
MFTDMVICNSGQDSPDAYTLLASPNRSASSATTALVFGGLMFLVLLIGIAFASAGAWLVLPFAGLEIAVIAAGVLYAHRHRGDYERLAIRNDALRIERHVGERLEKVEINRHWAQVVLTCGQGGHHCRLALRSHGREYEFGRYLDDTQRVAVARDLMQHTGFDQQRTIPRGRGWGFSYDESEPY